VYCFALDGHATAEAIAAVALRGSQREEPPVDGGKYRRTVATARGRTIIGTGVDGALPILPDVQDEATRRGIKLIALPTAKACELVESLDRRDVRAILHVTC